MFAWMDHWLAEASDDHYFSCKDFGRKHEVYDGDDELAACEGELGVTGSYAAQLTATRVR
jgi:hypothetical protein